MERLETLWKTITNVSLPENRTTASELLEKCRALLFSHLTSYKYLPKPEAVSLSIDNITKTAKLPSGVPEDLRDSFVRNVASLVRILYLNPESAAQLMEECATDTKESISSLAGERSVVKIIRCYFQKRRLILNIHRYIYECYDNVKLAKAHPFLTLFDKFAEDVRNSKALLDDLIGEFDFILGRLRDHAEKPIFRDEETDWLTLQLGELRDLSLLLFGLAPNLSKETKFMEKLMKPVQTFASVLQRFPVSPDAKISRLQQELTQQTMTTVTAFVLRYFSVGTPLFMRDLQAKHYLDRFFPENASSFILGPAAVLYHTSRFDQDRANQNSVENLGKLFAESKPFTTCGGMLRSEVMQLELKEILAGVIDEMGEQFLRVFGLQGVQQFNADFANLAAGVFHHPRETARFWAHWTEGKGSDLAYSWGLFVSDLRDRLPLTLMEFTGVMGSLLKGFKESGGDVGEQVGKINRLLWNVDGYVEIVGEGEMKDLTLVKKQADGVAIIRSERERFPLGSGILAIPANTMGWMVTGDRFVELKWVLHGNAKYSVWALIVARLVRIASEAKTAAHYGELVEDVGKMVKFYVCCLKADPTVHGDVEQVLLALCRSLGQLLQLLKEIGDWKLQNSLVKSAFDLCAAEATFRDLTFVDDLDLIAPQLFPKAVRPAATENEWITNGSLAWFSPFWQQLASNSSAKEFMRTVGKLASSMQSIVKLTGAASSNNPTVQQANIFLLNIGLPLVVQLEELTEGIPVLQYALSIVQSMGTVLDEKPTVRSVAVDCLLEGPAGQALVELVNRGGRLLNLFVHNDVPTRVFLSDRNDEIVFVQLTLSTLHRLLTLLPEHQGSLTALERALTSSDKPRQLQLVLVPNQFAELYRHPKHALLQICRFILNATDARVVQEAAGVIGRLVVLHPISLVSIVKNEADLFVRSVFRLLESEQADVVREMWRLVRLCDERQPRMIDVLVNLRYDVPTKKYELDIAGLNSLLDIVITVLKNPACDESQPGALEFCLQLFGSKNDLAEYLYKREDFWACVLDVVFQAGNPSVPWEKKLASIYACDLVSGECLLSPRNSPLFSQRLIDEKWTVYINDEIPKILSHFNRDVAQAAATWAFDSLQMKMVTRFFQSWCAMNLLCLSQESLKEAVNSDTFPNIIRPSFILLNRSLASPNSGLFSQSIVSGLVSMLTSWRTHLTMELFLSVLPIVEDLSLLVSSASDGQQWSNSARSSILHLDWVVLVLIGGVEEEERDVALKGRLRGFFEAGLGVVGQWGLKWDIGKSGVEQEEMGSMLGHAVSVIGAVIKLVGEDSDSGMDEAVMVLQSECICEKLLMKTVEMLKFVKHPSIARKFLDLFIHLSLNASGASLLRDVGLISCLAGPLSSFFPLVKEVFVDKNTAEMSVQETVVHKGQAQRAQELLEVYLAGLSLSFAVMRNGNLRPYEAEGFVAAQLRSLSEITVIFRGEPTLAAWRCVELLTRLIAEVVRSEKPGSIKDACRTSIPLIYHLVCHQLMKYVEQLVADPELLSGRVIQLILTTGLSCLKVMDVDHPELNELLTNQKYVAPSSPMKIVVEFSFGNPVSLDLAPQLSFGTFVHMIRAGIDILDKVDAKTVAAVVFGKSRMNGSTHFGALLSFLEHSASFFLQQATALAIGLADVSEDSWQETLRELNNEIMDMQELLHNFLNKLEENLESSSLAEPRSPKTVLSLISQLFLNFQKYFEALRDNYAEPSSMASAHSLPRSDRKKVTFSMP